MKRILVSAIVIALVAGVAAGATVGSFSDIETSEHNYFDVIGMDLRISDGDGNEYDDPMVPMLINVNNGWPECIKEACWDIHNAGDIGQKPPELFIHFKNLTCNYTEPKVPYRWVLCDDGECIWDDVWFEGAKPVTEPEFVAECGGIAGEDVDGNFITVPGVGCCFGEDGCELAMAINVTIMTAGPYTGADQPEICIDVDDADWTELDLSAYDVNPRDGKITIAELECWQISLGDLEGCYTLFVKAYMQLTDISEDELIAAQVLTDPGTGYGWFNASIPAEAKWDHWPTNALMYDRMEFDMSFELLSHPPPIEVP